MDPNASFEMDVPLCPSFHLSREQLKATDLINFVQKVFREQPDLPAFKIVPPKDWSPTQRRPNLDDLIIQTPIKQLAFGKTGSYRCVLVEEKVRLTAFVEPHPIRAFGHNPLDNLCRNQTYRDVCVIHDVAFQACSVSAYRDLASSEERLPPPKWTVRGERMEGNQMLELSAICTSYDAPGSHIGRSLLATSIDCHGRNDYKALERSFWKSVTINPPIYGADTPMSLFDSHVKGWGLGSISDLLKDKGLPDIPGVTTPMAYFGMWKSFFAWHVEDADLYSVNYLHWGAPKVWYCVPPSGKARFEQVAASMHPEAHRACRGFLRHKDILISPSVLRQFSVGYHMCKQNKGEYVVLNAAAYHSGFNAGFNTAEAVNFATEDWVEVGRRAIPCDCGALKDQVCIDMRAFGSEHTALSVDSQTASESDDVDSDNRGDGCSMRSGRECSSSAFASANEGSESAMSEMSEADLVVSSGGRKRARSGGASSAAQLAKVQRRSTAAAAGDNGQPGQARGRDHPVPRTSSTSRAAAKPLRAAAMKLNVARKQCSRNSAIVKQLVALAKPAAVVYSQEDEDVTGTGFELVVPLDTPASNKKNVMVQHLREGRDGLFRPSSDVREELRSSLIPIRTQVLDPGTCKPGFKLLTLRSRILGTQLI